MSSKLPSVGDMGNRRGRLAGLSMLVAAVILILSCSAARAGTWAVVSCRLPDGQPAPTAGWLAGGAGDDAGATNTCASPGGAMVAQVGDQTEQPAYQPATWTFTAPAGSTISGGTLALSFFTPEGQGYAETPENSYDAADVLANCQYNVGSCANQQVVVAAAITAAHAGGTQIFVGAECVAPIQGHGSCQQPGDPWNGANGVDAETDIDRAVIELSNDTTPTATAFTGGVLERGASGVQDLQFTAQDPGGPGIFTALVTIDGRPVYDGTPDQNDGQCKSIGLDAAGVREFLATQPCKQSVELDIPIDTAVFASGNHTLKVTLTDAAGNVSTVYDTTIRTNRVPHTPNGTPCAAPKLSLTADGQSRLAPIRWGKRVEIDGRLHCGRTPIPGAEVEVTGDRGLISVTTDKRGNFRVHLTRGPTRKLRFTYRAFADDTKPSAVAAIRVRVYPMISLTISPRATANGGTINWQGRIEGGPYPAAGVTLLIEVRAVGRWEAFDQVVTHNGSFAYRYTFRRTTSPTTYRFRIAMPVSGAAGYRYVPSASRAVAVHVS